MGALNSFPANIANWLQQVLDMAQSAAPSTDVWTAAATIGAIALGPLLLFRQARRQPPDAIGQVKADAYRGMLRLSLLVIAACVISAWSYAAASSGGTYVVFWGVILFGGLTLIGRVASYFLRTKPRLDALAFVGAAVPTVAAPELAPHKKRLGFWGWVGILVFGFFVLNQAVKVLYYATGRPSAPRSAMVAPTRAAVATKAQPTRVPTKPAGIPSSTGGSCWSYITGPFAGRCDDDLFTIRSQRDEAGCATGPLYPVGTILELSLTSEEAVEYKLDGEWRASRTLLRVIGPYQEAGVCDLWPVEVWRNPPTVIADAASYQVPLSTGTAGLVDERAVTMANASSSSTTPCVMSQWDIAPDWRVLHEIINPYPNYPGCA